ncbi:MAG: hypothetical protein LC737_01450, partial [Chloroflexi bacterium]|nr:hypothetical protein [Chloroflexota bacterium]
PATSAATSTGTSGAVRIAVQAPDKSVNLVDLSGKSTLLAKAAEQLQPGRPWYAVGETVYAISTGAGPSSVYAVTSQGSRKLDVMPTTFYGFAPSTSGTPLVTWGTGVLQQNGAAQIDVSAPDGSNKKTLVKDPLAAEPRVYRVEKFSRDDQRIFFGKEPTGLGGYILFGGLTSLWTVNVADGKATEVISEKAAGGFICIDAISPDETRAATHCNRKGITVVSLKEPTTGAQTITPPSNVQFQQIGNATFSPDSARVTFAVARGNPDNEQGWVFVSDGLSGNAKQIAQSQAKNWYSVVAWPDPNTIVLQSNSFAAPTGTAAVWVVRPDGSGLTKLADGTFLAQLGGTR